jgi:photosystem II stability/assembly factor-like uncharacterized protein
MRNLLYLLPFLPLQFLAQTHLPYAQESEYKSDWKFLGPINPNDKLADQHAGVITAININPSDTNEIYIGTMTSGLFHTKNRGLNWICLTDNYLYPIMGVKDIHVDFTKTPHTVMLATGSSNTWYDAANFGVIHSTDGGQNWSKSNVFDETTVMSYEIKQIIKDSASNLYYAFGKKEIMRSNDQGKNWEIIYSPSLFPNLFYNKEFEIISILLSNVGQTIYFSTRANPLFTDLKDSILLESDFVQLNNCAKDKSEITFIKRTNELKQYYHNQLKNPSYAIKLSKGIRNTIWINRTFVETREHALYHYNIETNQITSVVSPNNKNLPEDIYWMKGLTLNQSNEAVQYLCGNVLYKSTDTGMHFKMMYGYSYGSDNIPHADIRSVFIAKHSEDGEQDEIYLGTDGGLSYSDNGGKSFRNLNGPSLPITQFYGLGSSPFSGMISAGSQDNSIMSYNPKTKEWIHDVRGDGYDVEYSKRIPGEAFGQYNSRAMMRTINDQAPFSQSAFISPKESASNKKTIAVHPNGTTYFAEYNLNILKHGSKKWESNPIGLPHQALAMACSESDSNVLYISSYWNALFKSTDGGKTFTDISKQITINGALYDTRIHAICVSPTDPDKVWISLGYFGDYYDLCKKSVRVVYSPDGGKNWIDISNGLPSYYVTDIVYYDGSQDALFASTYEGIYIKSSLTEDWKLFSTNFPKCIVSELNINYCRGKIIAATYGRGLWECDLPEIKLSPKILKGKISLETESTVEALFYTTDISLHKKASLYINCTLHMPKGKSIYLRNKNQLTYGPNGRIVNDCGETWGGLKYKK